MRKHPVLKSSFTQFAGFGERTGAKTRTKKQKKVPDDRYFLAGDRT
jgi:hypothetical protein